MRSTGTSWTEQLELWITVGLCSLLLAIGLLATKSVMELGRVADLQSRSQLCIAALTRSVTLLEIAHARRYARLVGGAELPTMPFDEVREALGRQLSDLRRRAGDDSEQNARARVLQILADKQLAELGEWISEPLRRQWDARTVRSDLRAERALINAIHALASAMERAEQDSLVARSDQFERQRDLLLLALWVLTGMAFAATLGAAWQLRRDIRRMRRDERSLRYAVTHDALTGLAKADRALYDAKNTGRNRTVAASAGAATTFTSDPPMLRWKHILPWAAFLPLALALQCTAAFESGTELRELFDREVDRRVELPESEQDEYAHRLAAALAAQGLADLPAQYFVLADRDPHVQAVMIYWKSPEREYRFIGASPASTGKPGEYEHFQTPTGVFEHSVGNFDFRAEGTVNEFGIRGYGVKGTRVYDFGWVTAERGWGRPGQSAIRLQMHATDPDLLEPQLGLTHSKGCIRIPATLDVFIDRYGILDADYERARAEGKHVWVLRADRVQTPWSGRYLVIVTSKRSQRQEWSPPPGGRARGSGLMLAC